MNHYTLMRTVTSLLLRQAEVITISAALGENTWVKPTLARGAVITLPA